MNVQTLLVALAAVVPLAAQRPSSWAMQSVPGVDAAAVQQLGKLVYVPHAGQVHVFSACTRDWRRTPLPANATLRGSNDWLLITDGRSYTAFSSYRGTFETIALSAASAVVNPTSQRNDGLLLVIDGQDLWAFSCFRGLWLRRTVSAAARIAVQRQTAVVADGATLLGLSAHGDDWVQAQASAPATQVVADGNVGIALAPGTVHCFSARRQTWTSAPSLGAGAAFALDHDVAAWSDGASCLAFSGLRGAFAQATPTGAVQLATDQAIVAAMAPAETWLFSGVTAKWLRVAHAPGASVSLSAATALVIEPNAVHAYSALLGAVSTAAIAAANWETNWTVADAVEQGSGQVHLFSVFTGQWTPAPASSSPRPAFGAILLQAASGFRAFSARSGRFVDLPAGPAAVPHVDLQSGLLVVEEPGWLHAFDPRRETWVHQATSGGVLSFHLWRTALLALEGDRAFGFGTQLGEIEAIDAGGAIVGFRANSESAGVVTADAVFGFSAVPDLTTLDQFPEFRRACPRGSTLDLQLWGPAGAGTAVVLAEPGALALPTAFGPLYLDPASAFAVPFSMGIVPAEGRAVVRFAVPDDPRLSGMEFAFQGAVLPGGAGGGWLTRMCGLVVL